MDILIDPPVKTSRGSRATIAGTIEQVERWRQKRKQLGITDAQLLGHVLPMLEQIKGVSNGAK